MDSPWQRGPVITTLATGPGTLIQSDVTSGGHGLLEVLVPEGSRLSHYIFGDLGSGPAGLNSSLSPLPPPDRPS